MGTLTLQNKVLCHIDNENSKSPQLNHIFSVEPKMNAPKMSITIINYTNE